MAAYLLDSSAATKLYVREIGNDWMIDLADPVHAHDLLVVRVTPIEVAAALFRRVRGGSLTASVASVALSLLRLNVQRTFRFIEVSPALADLAVDMAERHGLRGYDCIQLAGAVLAHRQRAALGLSPLTLVSADTELNSAAQAEGLQVEDPNLHP